MSIRDVAAQLEAALSTIDDVRTSLDTAAVLIDEATEIMGTALAGTSDPDSLQALAWFGETQQVTRPPFVALRQAEDAIRAYLATLAGPGVKDAGMDASSSRSDQTKTPPVAARTATTPERIEQLRRDLPPPVTSGIGQKTHGRWIDQNNNVHTEISGKDDKSDEALRFFEEEIRSRRIPVTVVDVEIKLAAHMRKNGIQSTTLVINNLPCRGPMGCNELIPVILPAGYTMTVHGPDGFRQEYKGGGTSKWVP